MGAFCDVAEGVAAGAHRLLLAGLFASSFYFMLRDVTGLTFGQGCKRGGYACLGRRIVLTADQRRPVICLSQNLF